MKLDYPDKYRLWSDLVRSSTDRLFVPTEETVKLGTTATIEIGLPESDDPVRVEGQVVGRRRRSRRFAAGAYVRILEDELEKCRRFLGLRRPAEAEKQVRSRLRVRVDLVVEFVDPETEAPAQTRNVSESGLFLVNSPPLANGQEVSVVLHLPDSSLPLRALTIWTVPTEQMAGLELVEQTPAVEQQLGAFLRARAAKDADTAKASRLIVVADDEPAILEMLTRALFNHGYEVFRASDGDQAIDLIRSLQPDLVVLDVLLPGVDGAHICRTMRSDVELSSLPVILLSALDAEELHRVADESGATDYLQKPLHLGDLLDLLGAYLPGSTLPLAGRSPG